MAKLIILNEKIDDNMEIAKSLKESGLLTTGVSETIVIRTEHSLETRAEPAVYLVYVENRLILEPSTLLGARNVSKY